MDQETKQEFEKLAGAMRDGFQKVEKVTDDKIEKLAIMLGGCFERVETRLDDIESRMATKDDLKNFPTRDELRNALADLESRLGSRIDAVRVDVDKLKEAVEKFDERDKADANALASNIVDLRQRVAALEAK